MNSTQKPAQASGLRRIKCAFFYSLSGFKIALADEAAFRQELLLIVLLTPLCLYLPFEPWLKVAIIGSHVVILITELLNTAVESVVDAVFPGFHHNAKKAKDTASAAVLLAIFLAAGVWIYALCTLPA